MLQSQVFRERERTRMDGSRNVSCESISQVQPPPAKTKVEEGENTPWLPIGFTTPQTIFLTMDRPESSHIARTCSLIILLFIVLSSATFVLETLPRFRDPETGEPGEAVFAQIEVVSMAIFTLEYVLRLSTVGAMTHKAWLRYDSPEYKRILKEATTRGMGSRSHNNLKARDRTASPSEKKNSVQSPPPQPSSSPPLSEEHITECVYTMTPPPTTSADTPDPDVDATDTDGEVRAVELLMAQPRIAEPSSRRGAGGGVGGGVQKGRKGKERADLPLWRVIYNFVKAPMNVIDLIAILPYYISLGSGGGSSDFAVIRILRLARIFRVFKLGKYSRNIQLFGRVMRKSSDGFLLLGFFLLIAVVLFGSLVFFAEQGTWNKDLEIFERKGQFGEVEESPFLSIPDSFWWVIVTTTTVGYGDMVPTSLLGKLIAVITMHIGILVLALPITLIGTNFNKEYERMTSGSDDEDDESGPSSLPYFCQGAATAGPSRFAGPAGARVGNRGGEGRNTFSRWGFNAAGRTRQNATPVPPQTPPPLSCERVLQVLQAERISAAELKRQSEAELAGLQSEQDQLRSRLSVLEQRAGLLLSIVGVCSTLDMVSKQEGEDYLPCGRWTTSGQRIHCGKKEKDAECIAKDSGGGASDTQSKGIRRESSEDAMRRSPLEEMVSRVSDDFGRENGLIQTVSI
eukprot:Rmarinus@m.23414